MFKDKGSRGCSVTREDTKRYRKKRNSKNGETRAPRDVPGLCLFCRQSHHFHV